MRTFGSLLVLLLLLAAPARAEFMATESDFQCVLNGAKVSGRDFRIFHNDPDQLAAAVALVRSGDASAGLPEGTILQLVSSEAMVKRGGTFNPTGNGWEFFRLGVTSTNQTEILARGGAEVLNVHGKSCQACHTTRAASQDLVAGMTEAPNLLRALLVAYLQSLDARCK